MSQDRAETVLCFFRVIPDREQELLELCRDHDRTLRQLGLCSDTPTALYRGADEGGERFVVKLFEWKSAAALEAARRHPEVQRLWEAMEPLCEARDGRPSMEFPHVERVEL